MDKDQVLRTMDKENIDRRFTRLIEWASETSPRVAEQFAAMHVTFTQQHAELESLRAYKIKTESGEHACSLAVAAEWEKSEEYIAELEAMRKRVEGLVVVLESGGWEKSDKPSKNELEIAEELRAALGDSHE